MLFVTLTFVFERLELVVICLTVSVTSEYEIRFLLIKHQYLVENIVFSLGCPLASKVMSILSVQAFVVDELA